MYRVTVRFYEELNFFLKDEQSKQDIPLSLIDKRSVKDLIESLGVPHPEVDLILVNGRSVGFDYAVGDGDRISVYPQFERLDISGVTRLRPNPLRVTRFVADVHLGVLVKKLRLLGFDTVYDGSLSDSDLASISQRERRILLTRDRQLLMRGTVSRGLYVRSTDPETQIREIIDRLDLSSSVKLFGRCSRCNGPIAAVDPGSERYADAVKRVPAAVAAWCDEYSQCDSCGQIYWKGSHYERLREQLSQFVNMSAADH